METGTKQRQAVKAFVKDWTGKGYEKGETQRFWLSLLHNVFGVDDPTQIMQFEIPVKTITKEKGSDFIDAYISSTKVLIEQKGSHIDLSAKARQSDGTELTPYQQGRRYAAGLPLSMAPRWIVACNFTTFEVHDMEHPNDAPEVILLQDLEKEFTRLSFLVDDTNVHIKKELEVSIQAGEIVGVLYEKFLAQYIHPENPDSQKSLNKLCVRLVFCLYAEDAGIFGSKNMFHDYMSQFPAAEFREKLMALFKVLDTAPEDRDPYMDESLAAFPFVSGGMFAGDIEIPRITEEIRTLILQRASDDFDWSLISPTIFGAVFESTLNPATRRAGGMHYTSLENIHKVIDPLFLDDLKAELADIKAEKVVRTKKARAAEFQDKLASLKFLDPACGSGNFLTESYTWLRRLENEAIKILYEDRVIGGLTDPIKVSIYQFYGIEINDFACSVSQAALWIAETQMLQETDAIVGFDLEPLPLKDYHNIHEGNALRMDWNDVVPATTLNYIMGNPPFIGYAFQNSEQKSDLSAVCPECGNNIDYVVGWYFQAARMMIGTNIRTALVSTNSITQGEQVSAVWKPLMGKYGIHLDFAWRTFVWASEANQKAHVHCVIIGFSSGAVSSPYRIFDQNNVIQASNISPYLVDAPTVFVERRVSPICQVPPFVRGCQPTDDGNLILTEEDRDSLINKEPQAEQYIRPFMMGKDFIQRKPRYCIWLLGADPAELRKCPNILQKVENVRAFRSKSTKAATREKADTPTLFDEIREPRSNYVAIPKVSSGNRKYIPVDYLSKAIVPGDMLFFMQDSSLYHFGVIDSALHMFWMKYVCGRLKSDYRFSNTIVYNNFPWPTPTDTQKAIIEQTAQGILDARARYPDSSLADLYDDLAMPPELRKAHRANDLAVLEAYGFPKDASEAEIVARLFKMYQELTEKAK